MRTIAQAIPTMGSFLDRSTDRSTLTGVRTDAAVRFQRPELPDAEHVARYLRLSREAQWFSNDGPCAQLFAERLAGRVDGRLQAVPVANATLGLMVALRALTENSTSGATEVLMPSFTYIATLSAVVWTGFEPVFVDVEPGHWHLDPTAMASAIEERGSAVGCLLPCSTFGAAPPRDVRERWERLGREAGVPILVDSAAGYGSTDELGTELGAEGNAEVFSFHATKPLAIGEGGVVMTRDQALAERVHELARFGLADDRSLPGAPGLNAKMSEAHAAIGLAALDRHDDVLRARRTRASTLRERIDAHLEFQQNSVTSTWQFVPALAASAASRAAILERARKLGVEVRTYHEPLHLNTTLRHHEAGELPVTEDLASRVVSLPMANDLDGVDLKRISSCVTEAGT